MLCQFHQAAEPLPNPSIRMDRHGQFVIPNHKIVDEDRIPVSERWAAHTTQRLSPGKIETSLGSFSGLRQWADCRLAMDYAEHGQVVAECLCGLSVQLLRAFRLRELDRTGTDHACRIPSVSTTYIFDHVFA